MAAPDHDPAAADDVRAPVTTHRRKPPASISCSVNPVFLIVFACVLMVYPNLKRTLSDATIAVGHTIDDPFDDPFTMPTIQTKQARYSENKKAWILGSRHDSPTTTTNNNNHIDIDAAFPIDANRDEEEEGEFRDPEENNSEGNPARDGSVLHGDNEERKEEDTRPWLILHVGPPKTGTTTIQQGLADNAYQLARKDNYYFMGHVGTPKIKSVGIGKNMEDVTMWPVKQFGIFLPLDNDDFLVKLRQLQRLGHNAVISAEQFTSRDFLWRKLYNNYLLPPHIQTGPITERNLTENEEPLFQFKVKIVVAYRHFFEWLPSLHHQIHYVFTGKEGKHKKGFATIPGIADFCADWLNRLVQYDPDDPKTSIYTTSSLEFGSSHTGIRNKVQEVERSHGSIWSYLFWTSRPELYDRVEVLDLHQQPKTLPGEDYNETDQDLFANFVCQSLPSASHTCRHLTKDTLADKIMARTSHTEHFASIIDKHRIFALAMETNRTDWHRKNRTPKQQNAMYNRMNAWFEDSGLVNGVDHPELRTCLDPETTHRLKQVSWNFLLQMVKLVQSHPAAKNHDYSSWFQSSQPTSHLLLSPQRYPGNNNNGIDDDTWMVPTKAAHDASFDKYVDKGKFCQLNVKKILEDDDFVQFVFKDR